MSGSKPEAKTSEAREEDAARGTSAQDLEHPAGVRRAIAIVLMTVPLLAIPYAVPGLERYRVVDEARGVPFARMLRGERAPASAAIGGVEEGPTLDIVRDDEALLASAPLPSALPTVATAPQSSERADRVRPRVPATLPAIDPAEWSGLTREIEDPDGRAMRHFHRRLLDAAQGREGTLARIAVYGTSLMGADRVTSTLRGAMQARFGDGGKGFVPIAPGWRYQRHRDVRWEHEGWRTWVVNRGNGPLDRYGYGGVVAESRGARSVARFATLEGGAVSRFALMYQAHPEGGELALRVDDEPPRALSTRAGAPEDRTLEVDVAEGPHRLEVRAAEGASRLYGVVMERDGPGVVVDALMLIGALTRVLLHYDEPHLRAQIAEREPDLLLFWLGSNDAAAGSVGFVRERYVTDYREVIRNVRAGRPGASCLVMSILDVGERESGAIRTRRRVPRIVDAQREVARAEGCAFFDAYRAFGGEGTMRRWYAASPRLVETDLGHLTESGTRVVGRMLYKAILADFAGWIAQGAP